MLAGRYELLALLGRGGMGLVFKALDRTLGEVVAVKVLLPGVELSPEILKRFREEAKLARKVRHRNVCAIHSYEEDGDIPFIVMELVVGTDLKHFLQRVGSMEWEDGFEVALQVADGLSAIHEMGVVHRDLKPANITRDDRGTVRVMDFGIAKGGTQAGITDDGKVVCTIDYVSPEQLMGEEVDARSDIYSFGIVIYELFTGRVPFRGDTPAVTMRKHLQEPPPLQGVAAELIPKSLIPVLERALAKDRKDRFSDAKEMNQALQAAREEMRKQGTDPVDSPSERRPDGRPPRRPLAGPYPAEALLLVPTLVRALVSSDRGVRVGAAEALTRTPAESAREQLTKALADQDREVRERAAEALRRLDEPSPEVLTPVPSPPRPAPTASPTPPAPVRAGPGVLGTSSAEEALAPTSDIDVPIPARADAPPAAASDRPPPPAPTPPHPAPPPSPSRPYPPTPARGSMSVPSRLYWIAGFVVAFVLAYASWRKSPRPEIDSMTMGPPPPSIATPTEPPPTLPPTPTPLPATPTLPPPTSVPRAPVTPRPTTTTTLAPTTTTMPPPAPTPEPPATTLPPTLPPTSVPVPPAPGALVEASDPGVKRPVCASCPPPPLPLIAEDPRYAVALRQSGSLVELRVLVDENGGVTDTLALTGDKALAESAMKAVRLWKYAPAEKQGVKVKVWLIVPIQFTLPPPR